MMIETSGVGAVVDIARIPVPEGVDLKKWLLSYLGSGFVFACDPSDSAEIIRIFSETGCEGSVCGRITDGTEVVLEYCGGR